MFRAISKSLCLMYKNIIKISITETINIKTNDLQVGLFSFLIDEPYDIQLKKLEIFHLYTSMD